ncbi:MAG: FAD-binding oxidoreductase, partial [Clostridiales bacterium]|nr:FAD-binding oxidoreductase [Clostridiales bacterium]
MKYGEVTPEIIRELEGIAGPRNVIYDEERMQPYSHDETPAEQFSHMPGVVVKPINTQQIVKIVKLAVEHLIPVTPRGAGTGLSGGAIPIYGGILLSVEKMNKVIEIDYANMMITVESGLLTNEINELVADQGLFFAGYPMSLESCFVGGNIAE